MKKLTYTLLLMLVTSCAGMQRKCASGCAEDYGADWIVAQYTIDGNVLHCWRLENTSIANETNSDGIYWEAPSGNLIHISNFYNRIQVSGDDWDQAMRELNLNSTNCPAVGGQ